MLSARLVEPIPDTGTDRVKVATQGDSLLILVIEDILSDSSLIERHLEYLGYRVEIADSAELGLEMARHTLPSAIILDIELPGIDGYQALGSIQADDKLNHIPVIVSSVHQEARERVIGSGAHGFVAKPIDRNKLETVLRECVDEGNMQGSTVV